MASQENRDLITAYWREVLSHCQTKRTAQDHAKKGHPKWIAWLATQGRKIHDPKATPTAESVLAFTSRLKDNSPPPAEGDLPPPGPLPAPPAIGKPIGDRTPEEHAECTAWEMFVENSEAARRCARTDAITAAGFARIACQCLSSYHSARQKRIQSDIENRRLLPVSEYDALCDDIRKLTELWRSLIPDLASQIDPADPARINRLFDDWVQRRLNPAIRQFIGGPALAA